jgi:hypothetical protein
MPGTKYYRKSNPRGNEALGAAGYEVLAKDHIIVSVLASSCCSANIEV